MRVFHFMKKEHGISNLKNGWLKVATINDLNDPFEFYVSFCGPGVSSEEDSAQTIKDHYHDKVGFLCFSKRMGSPVQWAHYAGNHSGLCFEFEIEETRLLKIKYRKKPYTIDVSREDWRETFVDATLSKYAHWSYEQERRMVIKLDAKSLIREGERIFIPFDEFGSITAVYSGIDAELLDKEVKLIKDKGIEYFETKKSRRAYSIEKA